MPGKRADNPKRKPPSPPVVEIVGDAPRGDPFYAMEKLCVAVHTLATGNAALRVRLSHAYYDFVAVEAHDIPESLLPLWQEIRDDLTAKPAKRNGQGAIGATLSGMRVEKAQLIASRICELADRLKAYAPQP